MLKKIKAIFLDLDGTLYFRKEVIPGAPDAVGMLRQMGYRLRFLTNTDSKAARTLCKDLLDYGFTIGEEEVHTPAETALHYLNERKGIKAFSLVSDELMESFRPYNGSPGETEYVVIGDFRDKVSYGLINEAFRHIDSGARILALQKARYFYSPEGKNVDTGAFVSLFEYASEKKATLLGKPDPHFFMTAIRHLGLKPEEVCIVGDDLTTDIKGARQIGAMSVLVQTGKFKDQIPVSDGNIHPDHIIGSIADLANLMRQCN